MEDKKLGCLIGLATGDALGASVEFKYRDTFPKVTAMNGGGPFGLLPGEWTDDTSLALCTAQSIFQKKKFDPIDQMNKYFSWHLDGYMSSNGICFDIGHTTYDAINKWAIDKTTPYHGSTSPDSAGNGSIMRIAPIPIFFSSNPDLAIDYSAKNSKLTHGATMSVDACRYMAGILVGAIRGDSKYEILRARYHPTKGQWEKGELHPEIERIAEGSFKDKKRYEIESSGWVVHTLEAALWAFASTRSFRDSLIRVVNLGYDSDTTGAVCGQIAGAYYGEKNIPNDWSTKLAHKELLYELSLKIS